MSLARLLLCFLVPVTAAAQSSELVVRVLNVGQGDAILIQNGGSNVLVDGGPQPSALRRFFPRLLNGRDTLDAVIITHAHADHYAGLHELLGRQSRIAVTRIWENGDDSNNHGLARLRADIDRRVKMNVSKLADTDDPCGTQAPLCTLTMRGGAKLHILRPEPGAQNENDRSVALKLVGPDSASFTMWLAGDAEQEEIRWFDQTGYSRTPGMRASVLKANHHGSSDGISPRYLDLVRPRDVVASLAAKNDYGHIHDETRQQLTERGIAWYRTDQNGTLTIRSPGTPGGGYTISVERGAANASGPSDGLRVQRRR